MDAKSLSRLYLLAEAIAECPTNYKVFINVIDL